LIPLRRVELAVAGLKDSLFVRLTTISISSSAAALRQAPVAESSVALPPDVQGSAVMPTYRFYTVEHDGHIADLPAIVDCHDDRTALKRAKNQYLDGKAIEVWNLQRFVTRLEPTHE
jgi:predicted short-subunit dehydrogenase-like oxidoreductase (DUF2520 family)